ncbi:PDZ domain-containing protein [Micrococcus lylae]|uniref:YlbL family protein n=1 Tax=Micrococcus lylae TaxID=1273 RepID=UPI0021A418DB|nr:S16 family serine protease [Micrococcus lylae]MCT2007519.1 PDZ domain-containing protein [Micrococcus lylae]MCT2071260.1 PDZ domain-containing protein [Micrococcus lylae]
MPQKTPSPEPRPDAPRGPASAARPRHASPPAGTTTTAARRRRPHRLAGWIAAASATVAVAAPTPYIVESPGPAIDVLGTYEGHEVLTVTGEEDTAQVDDHGASEGRLDMTTVLVGGPPTGTTTASDLLGALLDPGADVVPRELVYPTGTTSEEVSAGNTAAMASSQEIATAAALTELGVDYRTQLTVQEFTEGSASEGALQVADVILEADGEQVSDVSALKNVLNASGGDPVPMTVRRDGEQMRIDVPVSAAPTDGPDRWLMGAYLQQTFEFPVQVDIALEDIGGPSAGLMFALSIVDRLSPGDLTGGRHIAGTGTITPDGVVGAIGGIPQKVRGAREAGAEVFLAPMENCADLDGRVPEGLTVYAVDTLSTARDTVDAVAHGRTPEGVRTCG